MPKYEKFNDDDGEDEIGESTTTRDDVEGDLQNDRKAPGVKGLDENAASDSDDDAMNYDASADDSTRESTRKEKINGRKSPRPKVCIVQARRVSFRSLEEDVEISTNNQPVDARRRGSHEPLGEFELRLAACLVRDVRYSRSVDFEHTEKSLKSYIKYNSTLFRWGQVIVLLINLMMALFERPALNGDMMPYFVSIILELFCILFYILRFCHLYTFSNKKRFWKDKKNIVLLICIILTLLDIFMFVIVQEVNDSLLAVWPRWSRPLRPFFLCNLSESNQIRRAFRNIRRTIPDIFNVLVLFFMTVALFALLGVKLFGSKGLLDPQGRPYFVDYFDAVWDLYVLVTTANNPDVMMPAYDQSSFYSIFFLSYLIICLYLFMSIILAVIYNNYKKHLKNEVQKYVFRKRRKLGKAFEMLKTWANGRFVLPKSRWYPLMEEVVPGRGPNYADLLWQVLDVDGDNYITKQSFLNIVDLLNVGLSEVRDREIWFARMFPRAWNNRACELLRAFVRHKAFRVFFDVSIVANAFVIGLVSDNVKQLKAEYFFLFLFTLEILLKLFTFGSRHFFTRLWNIFDTVIIGAALIGTIIEVFAQELAYNRETLDVLMVLRVLRLVKIIGSVERFKIVVKTILNIGPSIFTYAIVCFVFFYIYAIVGMELFSGMSRHGNVTADPRAEFCFNENLKGSDFAKDNYCKVNFNNLASAMVTLFTLMVVNQWHVIAEGFVLATSKWARIYFFSFHMVVVILVLNIFTAFILEVFILEYSLGKGKLEFAIETKIHELGLGLDQKKTRDKMAGKNRSKGEEKKKKGDQEEEMPKYESLQDVNKTDVREAKKAEESGEESDSSTQDLSELTGIRFKLTKKKSRKTVEVMLQRLFEDELADGEEMPDEEDDEVEILEPPSPLTLRNVLS